MNNPNEAIHSKMSNILFKVPLFFLCICIASCGKKDNKLRIANRGDLIEAVQNGVLSKDAIIERITELPAGDFANYGVTYYSITYRTEYMGKPIDSRGLLILPNDINTIDLILYCHGTELPSAVLNVDNVTPSLYDGSKETHRDVRNMGLSWATAGFAVFLPDYIGYGLTLGKDHPYIYFPEMFKSNIDGLLAVKKFLQQENRSYDQRLFLTGWSQGAGACLSAHKYIQEQYSSEFNVVASSGLSGPYNFTRFAGDILRKRAEALPALPIYSWGIYSINKFSGMKRPTDQIFSFPVFDQFSAILTPSNKPDLVFNKYFLDQWESGKDTTFENESERNSFSKGWKPIGKVFLHHGDADDLVPYFNSVDAYDGLTESGGEVKLYTYQGGGHDTELGKYIFNTLNDFNQLK